MMKHIKSLLAPKKLLLIALGYTTLLTIALLSPTGDVDQMSIKNLDKVVHFSIHMVLVFLWLSFFYYRNIKNFTTSITAKVLLAIFLYGILIEFLQTYFTTGRQGDVYDVVANTIGLLAGLVVFRLFQKRNL